MPVAGLCEGVAAATVSSDVGTGDGTPPQPATADAANSSATDLAAPRHTEWCIVFQAP
jgi:hypothetical protein